MKLIGHVSTAVIVISPLIYFRSSIQVASGLPEDVFSIPELGAGHCFILTGLAATLPDLDIILQKYLPIKHRGFASHSLWTALIIGLLFLAGYLISGPLVDDIFSDATNPALIDVLGVLSRWCSPFTALIAFLAVFVHLLGDSLTVSGVPLIYPEQGWKFPVVGGHARFDNYFLNLIPCVIAGFILSEYFGYGQGFLHSLGSWHRYFR
jgi:membrane-bound metal-dependent hydrolase YbcI (DUF457 family)